MSAEVHDIAVDVLTPLVGRAMATMYVSKAALSLGKATSELGPADVQALVAQVRHMMELFTSRELLDHAAAEISRRVG